MTVVEHLEELRHRLFVSILAIGAGAIVGWFLFEPVKGLLTDPYCSFMRRNPNLALNPENPCELVFLTVTEPFLLKLKMTFFLGLLLALPVVLYQLWRFITPGLLPRERRFAIPFVVTSLVLFALGAWFALLTLPKGLDFLLGFAGTARVSLVLSFAKYVGFVMMMILAFGISFEFPLILISLSVVGVLSSQKLISGWRYALLAIAVFAAVITPSADWFTMLAMMVPLLVFYALAIVVSRLLKR